MEEQAMKHGITEMDYFTLIGHAEYLRRVHRQEDVPNYFFELAGKIGTLLGDPELTKRADELRKEAK